MNALVELSNRMSQQNQNTLCCCGLDPDLVKFPSEILGRSYSDEEKVYEFLTEIIGITAPYVCAFKAQKAFFDCFEGGHVLLKDLIKYVHCSFPGIPVIIDCKIGDTENTMEAYTRNLFENLDADGVLVNPYMGDDVIEPFMDFPEKIIVVLVRTSNNGANVIQDIMTSSGKMIWELILDHVVNRWNRSNNMVPVLSSTAMMNLGSIRKVVPNDMNILFAGVGAQGGDESGVKELLNRERKGVFVNSSRGILYAPAQHDQSWQDAVKGEVIRLRNSLNLHR